MSALSAASSAFEILAEPGAIEAPIPISTVSLIGIE
jgi:hypothetical protein